MRGAVGADAVRRGGGIGRPIPLLREENTLVQRSAWFHGLGGSGWSAQKSRDWSPSQRTDSGTGCGSRWGMPNALRKASQVAAWFHASGGGFGVASPSGLMPIVHRMRVSPCSQADCSGRRTSRTRRDGGNRGRRPHAPLTIFLLEITKPRTRSGGTPREDPSSDTSAAIRVCEQ